MRTFLILVTIEVSRCVNRIFVARFADRENARSEEITQGGRSADLKQTERIRHLRSSYCSRDGVSVTPLNNDRRRPRIIHPHTRMTRLSLSPCFVSVRSTHIRSAFYSDFIRFNRNFSWTAD